VAVDDEAQHVGIQAARHRLLVCVQQISLHAVSSLQAVSSLHADSSLQAVSSLEAVDDEAQHVGIQLTHYRLLVCVQHISLHAVSSLEAGLDAVGLIIRGGFGRCFSSLKAVSSLEAVIIKGGFIEY